MTKEASEVKPNYGPVYAAAMYPELTNIALRHGYALAVHGSCARDFDLIAIPWTEDAGEPQAVIDDILAKFSVTYIGEPGIKPHGRVAHTFSIGWGHCALDLSFMPRVVPEAKKFWVPKDRFS